MTERGVVEYLANCAWQIPLLAAGAWALVELARPAVRTQYWLWASVLAMAVVLPLRGAGDAKPVARISDAGYGQEQSLAPEPETGAATSGGTAVGQDGDGVGNEEVMPEMMSAPELAPRRIALRLSGGATHWLVRIYVAAMVVAGTRLVWAWTRARRLVTRAREMDLGVELEMGLDRGLRELSGRLGVKPPRICESRDVAGPMLVGAFRPVLLLPEGAREYREDEMRAALCHELAHVRRRDYLVNLVCEAAMLPVIWHPAAHVIRGRMERTREMACDEMAAEAMESGAGYARCLVSVTRRILERPEMTGRTQAVGFFNRNMLEERVMRLTDEGQAMTGWAKAVRTAGGAAALAAVVGVSASWHVRPAFAAVVTQSAVAGTAAGVGAGSPATTTVTTTSSSSSTSTSSSGTGSAAGTGASAGSGAGQATTVAKPSAQVVVSGVEKSIVVRTDGGEPKSASTPVVIARGSHVAVSAEQGEYVHRWTSADGEAFAMVNHEAKEPNAEEQAAVEEKLRDAQAGAELVKVKLGDVRIQLDNVKLDKLKLDKVQIENAQKLVTEAKISQADIKLQMDKAIQIVNSPELKIQMEKSIRLVNSPELKVQLGELQKLNTEDVQRQMAVLKMQPPQIDLKLQMDAASKALADAGTKLQDTAKLNAEIAKSMQGRQAEMAKLQREIESGELKAKLDAATKLLEDVKRQMDQLQAK